MKKLSAKKKVKLIEEWSAWFYAHTDSFQEGTLGSDIAYLYAAICKDSSIEVLEKDCDLVRILKQEKVSKRDKIWNYIQVIEE